MKYRRILAGLLAVNIAVSGIWTGGITVSAGKENITSSTSADADNETVSDETEKADQSTVDETEKIENTTQDTNADTEESEHVVENSDDEADTTVNEEQIQTMSTSFSIDDLKFYQNGVATIASPEQMILLSYCDPAATRNIQIELTATGGFDLSTTIKQGTNLSQYLKNGGTADQDYTYQGLGSADATFQGKITGQTPSIKANTTIFKGLSSSATVDKVRSIEWSGDGTAPMLADTYVLEDDAEHGIPFKFTKGNGSLIETVKSTGNGTLVIKDEVTYETAVTVRSSATANAGLICNTLESGTIKLAGYVLPEQITINSESGAAGGFIGSMQGGTLEIDSVSKTEISNLKVTSTSGSAGSIVGVMIENAVITLHQDITVKEPTVNGKYAGGFAGEATNPTFSGENKITVKSPSASSGTNTGSAVGGLVGHYIAKGDSNSTQSLPSEIELETPKVTTNGGFTTDGGNAGGYFGILELQGQLTYEISGDDNYKNITSEYVAGNGAGYGAIAGKITSEDKKAAVVVKNVKVTSTNHKQTYYHGGLFGELGAKVYLQVSNVKATISDAYAQTSASGFGGVVGYLGNDSVLSITDKVEVTVSTGTITGGGGLVGYADSGSILELSGETDLSGVNYSASQYVGQLVGAQNCALVFAHGDGNGNGWKYIRSKFASGSAYVNDIGNYGEVIRLKANKSSEKGLDSELFSIESDSHEIQYGKTPTLSTAPITIDSAEAFALLSVAWNSHGVFSPDTNLTSANWGDLKSRNITFSSDVNLEGTGIIGISRDSDEDIYSGKISGNTHKVTLAIGETFGYKGDEKASEGTDGCGKIYATDNNHKYIGMFSSSIGSIDDFEISGKIQVSSANGSISVGSIAAGKKAWATTCLSKVVVSTAIDLDAKGAGNTSCVGGFYGEAGSDYIELTNLTEAKASIKIKNCNAQNSDVKTYAGGIIGYVPGAFKLKCNGMEVGGSIETDASNYAYVGGVIGFVAPSGAGAEPSIWVEIRNLVFDGIKISAPDATVACGGLLGSVWSRTGVYFMGVDDSNDGTNTKMTVKNASIEAPNASVGGLAYKASGIWEIRTNGIDIQKMYINSGKDLGLLVCHGEKSNVARGWAVEDGALYLRTTVDWTTAYKVAENLDITSGSVFDELVAHTAVSKDTIVNNDENGIVSLATTERIGVSEAADSCTTYQNRTTYGRTHNENGCSRYYYDLDLYVKTAADASATRANGQIDTPEELLLWSCRRYACTNIKRYFSGYDVGSNRYVSQDIEDEITTISSALDMKKYSYYPIQLSAGITIDTATITFYNEQIEHAEISVNNKSTKRTTSGTQSVQSQHYMMHCGLFLNHSAGTVSTNIVLNNVTFVGSIGKTDDSVSGVLFSGMVQGTEADGKQYLVKMNFKDVKLAGLKITDYSDKEYAPLLINQIGSYTKTEVKGLKTTTGYTLGTAVASSLIGNAGSTDGHQINMSFSNIILPDKKAGGTQGIFTHATLLESYQYADNDTSVATYNFYKSGDWPSEGTYNHQVTYGREISETQEYTNLQKWYYDKASYGKETGEVVDGNNDKDFSSWLPYVCAPYNEAEHKHEIKVNQRVFDIVTGCGTYGDPYVITNAGELEIISEYMTTNMPRTDWKITVTRNQNTYCTEDNKQDITFRYDGDEWVQVKNQGSNLEEDWVDVVGGETRSIEFMQRYIANAYYDLQGQETTAEETQSQMLSGELADVNFENSVVQEILANSNKAAITLATTQAQLTLVDFKGLGTAENPFRGVLTSTGEGSNTIITLKGANTGNGLIAYSYGSVIRNLTIKYQGDKKTLTYKKASSSLYPGNCFGGVIGCILGGDNIIDGVRVILADGWLQLDGDNKHLLQVGGYVGSVCGGGVIFRNMSNATGLTDDMITGGSADGGEAAYSSLYVNPYVGRVLDGCAFAVTDTLNNTDKNYQIQNLSTLGIDEANRIPATGNQTTQTTSITIEDARALLLLSAIVNSGAASSGSSDAYRSITETIDGYTFGNGGYGKVRNATYENIGGSESTIDFTTSVLDDTATPGKENTPYLITQYGSSDLFNLAVLDRTTGGAVLEFSGKNMDMSVYGSSYQGISARYASNAVASSKNKNSNNGMKAAGVVPMIQRINGNGTVITLATLVKEYADDDFHAASAGGVFNLLSPASASCSISNLKLQGKSAYSGVELRYYTSDGTPTESADTGWAYKSNIGVGSFAGSSSGALSEYNSYKWYNAGISFEHVTFKNMKVKSPASAGGLIGNLGRRAPLGRGTNATVADDIAILIQPNPGEQTTYVSCSFTNCRYSNLTVQGKEVAGGFCGYIDGKIPLLKSSLTVTEDDFYVGKDSSITASADDSLAGGLFGYVRRNVAVNAATGVKTAKWQSVDVTAGRYAGGLIGQIYTDHTGCLYQISNVQFSGTESKKNVVQGTASGDIYAGGIVGKVTSYSGNNIISQCEVENVEINTEALVSVNRQNIRAGGIVGQVDMGLVKINECSINKSHIYGSLSGGVAGSVNNAVVFTKCTISGGENNTTTIIKGRKSAAGIAGEIVNNIRIAIHDSSVTNASITCIDDWGAGGLIGDVDWNAVPNLYFFDSKVDNCSIKGPRAGGLAGDVRGSLNGSNILLKDTNIEASSKNNTGLLIGLTGNRNFKPMTIAGISIQNTTAKENGNPITKLYGTINNDEAAVKAQSYFSFADYNGTASEATSDLWDATSTSPYVVTSPVSGLSVWKDTNATSGAKLLYGDGASWKAADDGYTVTAEQIFNEATNSRGTTNDSDTTNDNDTTTGRYIYQETGVDGFSFSTNISTYGANQEQDKIAPADNFPVLVLTDNVSETVTNYLDILTNGGFTRANQIQDGTVHVDASVSTYTYTDVAGGKGFVRTDETSVNPALEVKYDANNRISEFSTTTEYDNTQSRFTLLTVTFTEKDESNVEHKYNIQIPVIVRRMLEINFTATLSSGTNFRATNYDEINDNAHLLESTGNPFTAYLTYTYNSDENGEYSEYGWNSYINAGGNVAESLGRTIDFQGSALPEGAQLTLIDRQNESKAYYYTIDKSTPSKGGTQVSLTDFKDSSDQPYQSQSIGELMGVSATPDTTGNFIQVDADGKPIGAEPEDGKTYNAPTVRIKNDGEYEYYRLTQGNETGTHTLSVEESTLKDTGNQSTVSENYYLVITVASIKEGETLNGYIQTDVSSDIPHQVHYRTRKGKIEDSHNNTASTYQISQGYKQELTENVSGAVKKLSTDDSVMTVDVVDKITIPSGQAFQDQDELYQKFSGSLIKTITEATGETSSAELFPDGTSGTAQFYVYVMDGENKQCYTYTDGVWTAVTDGTEKKALEYPWTAGNGLMDLPLSTDGTIENAVSLKTIRQNVLGAGGSEFYVEVKMQAKLPVNGLNVVPESKIDDTSEPTDYIKLSYTSQLSTAKKSLSYSTARALLADIHVKYYRDEPIGAKLTYEADEVSQLGINLLDLQYLDAEGENAIIDTTALYDMSAIKDLSSVLSKSKGIRFSIQLQNKNTENNDTNTTETYDKVLKLAPYLKVEVKSEGSSEVELTNDETTYSWLVPKAAYWNSDKNELKTDGILNGDILTQAIRLKVDIKNVEKLTHLYSNYKVVLVAEIINESGGAVANTNDSDNIIYTLTKINLAFVK